MYIPSDLIIQLNNNGKWIIYNVFTRNTVAVTDETLKLLKNINEKKTENEIIRDNINTKFLVWDIEIFSNYDGLFADPTRIIRDNNEWPESKSLEIKKIIKFLIKKNIIIEDKKKYYEIFNLKISLLDNQHQGNFHQQSGRHLLIEKRVDPAEWWVNQKFTKDFKHIKENPYKYIQENFLKSFFKKKFNEKHKIIDIGCGVGLYTKMMGQNGAQVLGIDPNKKYIEFAKKNKENNIDFKISEIGKNGDLDWIDSNSVDFMFMSDALLFYFVSPNPKQKYEIHNLLSSIKRILKKNGRLFSLEPHGLFFLRPWFGEIENPFTIITEYNKKKFDITPNLSKIIKSFLDGGYLIRDLKELYGNKEIKIEDKRAESFTKEFPIWWFFELEPEK